MIGRSQTTPRESLAGEPGPRRWAQPRERGRAHDAARQLGFMVDAGRALFASTDYEATLASVARRAVPAFSDYCAIYVLSRAGSIRRVVLIHAQAEARPRAPELEARLGSLFNDCPGLTQVLQTGQLQFHQRLHAPLPATMSRNVEHVRILGRLGFRSCIIAPLVAFKQVFGAIWFATRESERCFEFTDVAVAEHIALCAAIAVRHARLAPAHWASDRRGATGRETPVR